MQVDASDIDLGSKVSRRMQSIPPSGIRRFFEIASTMEDVISLGIGEPDFVSPQPIVEAVIESLREGKTGYTANAGLPELRALIARDYEERYNVTYDPSNEIIITVGVSEAMLLAMLATLDPGDEILIPEPCFVSYGPTARMAGAEVVYVPTYAENNFVVTASDIEARITPRSKVLFIGYPSNPTGAVLHRDRLNEIARVVVEHDLIVISDEIYDRLIYDTALEGGHTCVPAHEALRERTILIGGFSKTFAMTGWRIGYACAPAELAQAMYRAHQYIVMSAPTMAQIGAATAIREAQDDVERMRRSYDERRRLLVDGLRAAGLETVEPEGAFYCFPDVRSTGLTSEGFAERLLREEHVACVPGNAFGPSGEGYVRCSYTAGKEDLLRAIERIIRFSRKYQALNGQTR